MHGFSLFMQGGGWVAFAVLSAVFSAALYLVNQYMRVPAYLLVFWMRVCIVLSLTPAMTMFPWPQSPKFYAGVALTVLFSTYGDIRTFDIAARYGGGVVSRLQPLVVWGSFFIWFLFDPAQVSRYAAHPLNSLGIVAALAGCVYFAMRMNRSAINRTAFLEMLPALGCYVATTVLNKYSLMQGPVNGAVYGYMYVQSALAVFCAGGYAMWRLSHPLPLRGDYSPPADVHPRAVLPLAVLMMTGAWLCSMIYKNYAMVFTANPSYVAALGLMAPVFIALYYRVVGHEEKEETLSGFGIAACALALALLTVR